MQTGVAKEKLVSDLKVLIDDVEELVRSTADQTGETLSSLRQRVMQRLAEGKETLAQQQSVFTDMTKQAAKEAVDYAQKNPWGVLGVAVGISLVIGLLLWSQEQR